MGRAAPAQPGLCLALKTLGDAGHGVCVGQSGACGAPHATGARCWVRRAGPRVGLSLPAGPFQVRAVGFCWKPAEPAPPAASLGLWLRAGPTPGPRGETRARSGAWRHHGRCLVRWELLLSLCCPPRSRLLLPMESHEQQRNAGAWPICGAPVMGQQWEPVGDSERLCWVTAGLVLAQWMSRQPGVTLWLPHDQGPMDLWLTACQPQASREPVSTDRLTLVTWLRQDPPVQLTDPAGNHPATMLGSSVYYQSYKHRDRTAGATTPGSCSSPGLTRPCVSSTGGWPLRLVSVAHDAEWKPGLCPPCSPACSPAGWGYF